ncbi:MAG TPA: hypothetical protein VGQ57_13200, partial [Polyangiaceae bacterium]|nr:hypothetical protein [Polyangiaceae bacterium]
ALQRQTLAIGGGLPFSAGHSLTAEAAGIFDVDLASGRATALSRKLPYGTSCLPLSLQQKGLFLCSSDVEHASVVVSQALSDNPNVEKKFHGTHGVAFGADVLVVGASCSGAKADGVACVRSPGAPVKWTEVNVQGALAGNWQLLSWVPKSTGGAAALVLERPAPRVPARLALIDGATGAVTPFDVPFEQVAPRSFGNGMRDLVVLENGTLRGFTTTSGLSVDAKGHVTTPTRTFKQLHGAGPFALAADEASRLWQTTDYGDHWLEVARPPFEAELPAPKALPNGFGDVPRPISCTLAGCILEHESGMGSWLRLGWPVDPPRPGEHAAPAAAGAVQTLPAPTIPEPRPTPPRPKLRCALANAKAAPTSTAKPPATLRTAPETKKRAPRDKHPRTPSSINYGDAYLQDTLLTQGQRGVVRFSRTDGKVDSRAFEPLVATKAPFEVELVEPFDPAGRIVRTTGSLGAWESFVKAHAAKASAKEHPLSMRYPSEGHARPVLGAAAGRTDGAVFVDEDFSFWVSRTGKIRPIRPGCRADSGYVDAHGTLFVACGNRFGATTIEDTEHGRAVLELPWADRFRAHSDGAMSFFPPGQQLLPNPDALAAGRDGKLAIIRTASGNEPATVDLPAWLLSAGAPPMELAPWASLEPASSPACAKGDGYRALIQTSPSWLELDVGGASSGGGGMSAIVRWSPERVCLEAVEIPTQGPDRTPRTLVARFTGPGPSAAFVRESLPASGREAATCELVAQ